MDTSTLRREKGKIAEVDIVVNEAWCKGCGYCIEFCPMKVLGHSPKLNLSGVHPPVVKDKELCIGCGLCEELCPDFAIFMVPRGG